jgi:galactose mutarotase-like enzyme
LADERLSNIVLGGYAAGEGWVRVEDPNSFSVRVSQRQATPRFRQEDVFFVFWGEERLRYWCPEPWLGGPDALSTGRRVAFLPPGESFRWEVTVEVLR